MPDLIALSYWYEFINADFIDKQKVQPNTKCNLLMYIHFQFSLFEPTVNLSKAATQKEHQKLVFNIDYHLMQVKSIAECSKGSILQSSWPSLS